jgi:hypothetical protein
LFVALALVARPRLVVLDELTTGLDPVARRVAWDLVAAVRERGTTVLLVTQFMDDPSDCAVTVCGEGPLLARVAHALVEHGHEPADLRVELATLEDAYLGVDPSYGGDDGRPSVGVLSLPVHLAGYRERGVLKRLRASSLQPWAFVGAHVVVALVTGTPGATLLMATRSRSPTPLGTATNLGSAPAGTSAPSRCSADCSS